MRKIALAALTIVSFAAPPVAAFETGDALRLCMDTVLGTTAADVAAELTARGHDIREIETEGRKIEVTFTANGRLWEVYVSTETGQPLKIERE